VKIKQSPVKKFFEPAQHYAKIFIR